MECGKFDVKIMGDSGMFEKKESGYMLFARDKMERRWHEITGSKEREI
jgi:hypothetical protein